MPKRQMWKIRYNEDGEQVSWDESAQNGIDVKLTKKAWYKQGTGPAYRDTVYSYCKPTAPDRVYEDSPLTINVLDNDDNETGRSITYKNRVRKTTVTAGTGPAFQGTRKTYCNNEDGAEGADAREVREQRLPPTGSGAHISVERIKKATLTSGTGPAYQQKRKAHFCNEEEQLNDKSNTELLNPDGSTRPET